MVSLSALFAILLAGAFLGQIRRGVLLGSCFLISVVFLGTVASLSGCTSDPRSRPAGIADSVLQNTARHVIHATYADLHTEARGLLVAAHALQQRTTADNLASARQTWRDAHAVWEETEAFLFGPVVNEDYDSALDSWPINVTDLERVFARSDTLRAEHVASLEDNEKGFHAIEYLLFGKQGNKTVSELSEPQIAYLVAAVRHLETATEALAQAWQRGARNYGHTFVTAGASDNRTFYSQKSALRQLVASMTALANELAQEKLGAPPETQSTRRVESRFSGHSLTDFNHNVEGIRHLYTGDYVDHEGPGLDEIVKAEQPKIDQRFRAELDTTRQALNQIPVPFHTALTEHPEAVRKAQAAAEQLARTLDEDIKPLVLAL